MQTRKMNDYGKVIFVEGDDDFHFLCNLLEIERVKDVYVEKINGKTKLKQALRAFKNIESFNEKESIFVIVDADESFSDTEKSIVSTLNELNISSPKSHNEIAMNGNTKISFFIMPGKNKNGAIEDLIIDHASSKAVFKFINDFFERIKEEESSITSSDPNYAYPNNEKKAKVQVYLSCNKESDSRIGISMKNKTIDTNDNCFNEIKEFISKI
jgi:5S rRNA maturation endonuclease (ribonuclease M5)